MSYFLIIASPYLVDKDLRPEFLRLDTYPGLSGFFNLVSDESVLCLKNTFRSLFLFIFMVFEKVNSSSPNFYELWNTIHSRKNCQFFRHEKKISSFTGIWTHNPLGQKRKFWFSYCVKITQNVSLCILYTSMSNCSQKWTKKGERQQNNVGGALSLGFLLTSETLFSRETTSSIAERRAFERCYIV